MNKLSLQKNKFLNKGGYKHTDLHYVRNLQKETSGKMEIGEKKVLEKRRAKWTTYKNLNIWFNKWEGLLIDIGFERLKREGDECEVSVVFFDGQKDRIIKLDEKYGALDKKCGQRGGIPSFIFYSEDISGGASRANKNSYSLKIISGSSSMGDSLPLHFHQYSASDQYHTDHES